MDSREYGKCCECGCAFCNAGGGGGNGLKRKVDGFDDENGILVPGLCFPVLECDALRGIMNSQQQTIQHLYMELDEERNSSSTAANEAMSMILRLQRDKSVIQMEARQFKQYAEEKMAHDQREILVLEDLLYKREQVIQSLIFEAQAYKYRMMSYGLTVSEVDEEIDYDTMSQSGQFQFPRSEYPQIKCISNEVNSVSEAENEINGLEKYSLGGTHSIQHLKSLELRISKMEKSSRFSEVDMESPAAKSVIKNVIVGQSRMEHSRNFSVESSSSLLGYSKQPLTDFPEESLRFGSSFKKMDYVVHTNDSEASTVYNLSEFGDFVNDSVYSMDSAYNGEPGDASRESVNYDEFKDPEIQKLYMRVQALEAEKDSMSQTLISMSTDKSQRMLLQEIAQQLCQDMAPKRHMPLKKPSIFSIFPFSTVFTWVATIVFWRNDHRRSKYMFGLASNMGLLMLLDQGPCSKPLRCLTRPLV